MSVLRRVPLWSLIAAGVVLVVGLAALVAFLVTRGGGTPELIVTMRAAPVTESQRPTADTLDCLDSGRAPGPPSVDWPGDGADVGPNQVRGQAIAYEILLSTSPGIAEDSEVRLDLAFDRYRGSGGVGVDEEQGILCAFVDPSDPEASEMPASARSETSWTPFTEGIGAELSVDDLDAGENVVVEVWVALTDDPEARPGVVRAAVLDAALADGGSIELDTDSAVPVRFNDPTNPADVSLMVAPSQAAATGGTEVTYQIVLANTSDTAAAADLLVETTLDPGLSPVGVGIEDDQGSETTCDPIDPGSPARSVACRSNHLDPQEVITLELRTLVLPIAEGTQTRSCGATPEELCVSVDASWGGGSTTGESARAEEKTEVNPGEAEIGLAKYYPDGIARADDEILMAYLVVGNASQALANVTVEDEACQFLPPGGDRNENRLLDASEQWLFTCLGLAGRLQSSEATVTAFSPGRRRVTDLAVADFEVINPSMSTARSEDGVTVLNDGDDLLTELVVVGSNCSLEQGTFEPGAEVQIPGCGDGRTRAFATDSLGNILMAST